MFMQRFPRSALALGLCLSPIGLAIAQDDAPPTRAERAQQTQEEIRKQIEEQTRQIQEQARQIEQRRAQMEAEHRERNEQMRKQLEEMQGRLPARIRALPLDNLEIEVNRQLADPLRRAYTIFRPGEEYQALGLRLRPVPDVLRSHLDLPEQGGLIVEDVQADSPAADLIEQNDILLSVGETAINEPGDVSQALETIEGDSIPATVMRQGKTQTVTLKRTVEPKELPVRTTYRLGIAINEPDDAVRAQLGLPEGQGVIVMSVASDSAAEKAGIKPNDVLIELDGEPILGAAELAELVNKSGGEAVELNLLRDGEQTTIEVTPDSVETSEAPASPDGTGRPLTYRVGPGGLRFYGPGVMTDPETGPYGRDWYQDYPGGPVIPRQPQELRREAQPSPEMDRQLEEIIEQLKKLREEVETLKQERPAPSRRGRGGA